MKEQDYYIDAMGKWVFTAAYHEARGYCCGEACKHCPYNYEAVPEPIKTRAISIRTTLAASPDKNISDNISNSKL